MKKFRILKFSILLTVLIVLSGCDAVTNFLATETPAALEPTATPSPTSTPGTLGLDSPITLKLWLPPEFDPSAETVAAIILQARLDEYSRLHPGVRVQTRVKATTGSSGMIESLSGANTAAPLALPDLVLLSTTDAENAAERSLIFPLQTDIDFSIENDWYQFAAGLAGNGQTWGVPFAADTLVMLFRPSQTANPPTSWGDFFNLGQRLMFPISDPRALLTTLFYLSDADQAAANLNDLSIDAGALTGVLSFYQQGQASNLIPYWLTQLDSDQAVWDAYLENQTELAVTWFSRYLQQSPERFSAAMIPTKDGSAFTLARGWVWSISTPVSDRQAVAEDLAIFLSEADFTGSWTEAAGYLPARPSGLADWDAGTDQSLASMILPSAVAIPNYTTMAIVGPAFQQAATVVIKQELSVSQAAAAVIAQLNDALN